MYICMLCIQSCHNVRQLAILPPTVNLFVSCFTLDFPMNLLAGREPSSCCLLLQFCLPLQIMLTGLVLLYLQEACKCCPDCNRPVRTSELEEHKSYMCTSKHPNTAVKHKAEIRAWEKKLQQETSEKSIDKLVLTANEQLQECFKVLPQHGKFTLCLSESSSGNTK